jgi:hypothetical protein
MRDFVVQFLDATLSLCVCSGEYPSTGKLSTVCLPILRASHSGVEHICVSEPIQWTDPSVWCVNVLAQDLTYRSSSLFTAAGPALDMVLMVALVTTGPCTFLRSFVPEMKRPPKMTSLERKDHHCQCRYGPY